MRSDQVGTWGNVRSIVDAGGMRLSLGSMSGWSDDTPLAYGKVWHQTVRTGLAATGYDIRYLVDVQTVQKVGASLIVSVMLAGATSIDDGNNTIVELQNRSIGVASFEDGVTISSGMRADVHSTLAGPAHRAGDAVIGLQTLELLARITHSGEASSKDSFIRSLETSTHSNTELIPSVATATL